MKCAHAMKTRFTNNRLMMAMRTARILDQGRQTPKHKIRDVRVCASDEGMYGGSRPSGQKQARPHAERCACLLNGAIHNRRDCIASTKLHRGTRVAPKKCAARAPTAGALEDAARIAQQAFDHETRTRNDRAAHMTPMRVDQIDRHGRADIDYTYRTARSELSGANDGDKPIDAEPPRLRIRCGHATQAACRHNELGYDPACAARGRDQAPVDLCPGNACDDHTLDTTRTSEYDLCEILRPPALVHCRALPREPAVHNSRPFHARVANINQQDAHAVGLTLTSPETNLRRP